MQFSISFFLSFHFQVGDNKVLHMSNTSTNPPLGRCSESTGVRHAPPVLYSAAPALSPPSSGTQVAHTAGNTWCQFGTARFEEDNYVGGFSPIVRRGEGWAARPVPQGGREKGEGRVGHASAQALDEEGGTCRAARPRTPRSFLRPHVIGRRLRGPEGGGQGKALVARCAELQQLGFAGAHVPLGQALECLQAVLNSDSLQVVV